MQHKQPSTLGQFQYCAPPAAKQEALGHVYTEFILKQRFRVSVTGASMFGLRQTGWASGMVSHSSLPMHSSASFHALVRREAADRCFVTTMVSVERAAPDHDKWLAGGWTNPRRQISRRTNRELERVYLMLECSDLCLYLL